MSFLKNLFGKKEPEKAPFSPLRVDVHSHLIPGIDDGSKDMEDSLNLVRALVDLGYQKLITTPHIMSDAFRNTPEIILEGLEKLRGKIKEEGIKVEIEAAAEYYLDEVFVKNLGKVELMSFGGKKRYLLFETSYVSQPMALRDTIFKLKTLGYQPVMAHPERYQYFWEHESIEEVLELKERGCLMQVNLTSFAGNRGRRAAFIAKEMAKANQIDFVGTDLHRMSQVSSIYRAMHNSRELRNIVANDSLRNLEL